MHFVIRERLCALGTVCLVLVFVSSKGPVNSDQEPPGNRQPRIPFRQHEDYSKRLPVYHDLYTHIHSISWAQK